MSDHTFFTVAARLRARTACWAAVAALGLFASCDDSGELDGRVFVSGVKDFSGKTTGIAVDFIPTSRDADLSQVRIELHAKEARFSVDLKSVQRACLRLPKSGRLTLNASDAELTANARVRVVARRFDAESATTAAAGAGGAGDLGGECSGEPIDDAVWPSVGASVPAPPAGSGGSSGAGGAGNGGEGGVAGGPGGAGGAEGGSAGDNAGGAGAADGGAAGQGGA